MSQIVDLKRGVYRRIYGGAIFGRRINRVSIGAEFWFWRLHMIADDFGRFPAGPKRCRMAAAPLRDDQDSVSPGGPRAVWTSDVATWLRELEKIELITTYIINGELYGAICDFEDLQPANRNGRRIERYPAPPEGSQAAEGSGRVGMDPDSDGIFGGLAGKSENPGESKQSRMDPMGLGGPRSGFKNAVLQSPGESGGVACGKVHSESEIETEAETETEAESVSESNLSKEAPWRKYSDSDSTEWRKAQMRFQARLSDLIGRDGKIKHPPGSGQHNADITTFENWLSEIVEAGPTQYLVARFDRATELARIAASQARPVAYLTGCLRSEGLIPKKGK